MTAACPPSDAELDRSREVRPQIRADFCSAGRIQQPASRDENAGARPRQRCDQRSRWLLLFEGKQTPGTLALTQPFRAETRTTTSTPPSLAPRRKGGRQPVLPARAGFPRAHASRVPVSKKPYGRLGPIEGSNPSRSADWLTDPRRSPARTGVVATPARRPARQRSTEANGECLCFGVSLPPRSPAWSLPTSPNRVHHFRRPARRQTGAFAQRGSTRPRSGEDLRSLRALASRVPSLIRLTHSPWRERRLRETGRVTIGSVL